MDKTTYLRFVSRFRHFCRCLILGALTVMVWGCGDDGIRSYQATTPKPIAAQSKGHKQRMLAAIVPRSSATWFFKVMGPEAEVAPQKQAFHSLIASLHFDDEGTPHWTTPEGWELESGSGLRHATLHIPGDAGSTGLELTVTPLGAEAAAVLPNVNRWRNQLGLAPVDQQELGTVTETIEVDGLQATLVDLAGEGSGAEQAPFMSGLAPAGRSSSPLDYELPEGWESDPNASSMSLAGFIASGTEGQATVSVTVLAGEAGGVMANIGRWRNQIGLPPADDQTIQQSIEPRTVSDTEAKLVHLVGEDSPSRPAQAILGAILSTGDRTWFVKMIGPRQVVDENKAKFEAFLDSMRIN